MNADDIIKKLKSLAQLDIDAFHAYNQAIEKLDDLGLRHKMEKFRNDHERHVSEISDMIREMGGEPPEFKRDFKGFLIEGWTSLRSLTGNQGVLAAMVANESLTNRRYSEAAQLSLPAEVHALIASNYEDEKEHLAFIKEKHDYWVNEGGDSSRSQYY